MNIPTVAIYSDEDINSLHRKLADEAINIPGSIVSETYMNSYAIIKICKKYKINAIHPGYGLLSENADFVKLVENNNLIFVGPSSKIVRNMGEKDKAKLIMEKAGMPIVPGYHGKNQDKSFLKRTASQRMPITLEWSNSLSSSAVSLLTASFASTLLTSVAMAPSKSIFSSMVSFPHRTSLLAFSIRFAA